MLGTLKRVAIAIFTLFLVMTVTFFLIHQTPGDVIQEMAALYAQQYGVSIEEGTRIATSFYGYNLDEPLWAQYLDYVGRLLKGELGYSLIYRVSVNQVIVKALPWTVFVLSISLLLSFSLGMIMGVTIAWKRKTILDPLVTAYASFTGATPDYITALVLLIIFAIRLHWFPTKGAYDSALKPAFNWPFIKSVLHHAVLPIVAYTFENTAAWALAMKGSAVSVLGEDYITAARARGLKERRIMFNYMGRNAILPMVTGLAIALGGMLGGSALIETIFNYPGVGWFFTNAVNRRDYGMMQGLFLLTAAAVIFANLVADLLYSVLDPRIKLEE